MVKNIRVFFCVLFLMAGMFFAGEARATVDSVTLTPDAGTEYPVGSGHFYYKTGNTYTFTVNITTTGESADWSTIDDITLRISRNGGDLVFSFNPTDPVTVAPSTDSINDSGGTAETIDYSFDADNVGNFTITFEYTPTSAVPETAWGAQTISAEVTTTTDSGIDTANPDYGIVHIGINPGGVVVNAGLTSPGTEYPAASGFFYYKTGTAYNFVVDVTADGHGVECVEEVTFEIPGTAPITFSVDPSIPGVVTVGGDAAGSATFAVSNVVGANFRGTFTYTPTAAVTETAHTAATFQLSGSAKSVFDAAAVPSAGLARDYGIVHIGINPGGVVVTGAENGTAYGSPAANYYINGGAGSPYDFTVTVAADGHNWSCVTDVTLTLTSAPDIILSVNPALGTGTVSGGDSDIAGAVVTCSTSAWANGGTVTISYTPSTSVSEIASGAHNITATATSVFGGAAVTSGVFSHTYGIVATGLNSVVVTTVAAGNPYGTVPVGYYYIDSTTYDFVVTVNADGHHWDCVSEVTLTIPTTTSNIELSVVPPSGGGSGVVGAVTGGSATSAGTVTADFGLWSSGTDMTVTFHYTTSAAVYEIDRASHNIYSTAESVFDTGGPVTSANYAYIYGIEMSDTGLNTVEVTTPATGDSYGAPSANYYTDGNTYDFVVTVNAKGHNWSCVSGVTLTIPTTTSDIVLSVVPPAGGGMGVVGTVTGGSATSAGTVTADFGAWSSGTDMTVTFHYSTSAAVYEITNGSHNLSSTARSVFDTADGSSLPLSHTYGIVVVGVNSVNLFALGARTNLSTLDDYYLPNRPYTFTVDVTADGHNWSCVTNVAVNIPTGAGDVVLNINPTGLIASVAGNVSGGDTSGTVDCEVTGINNNNFRVIFTYTPSWDIDEKTVGPADITASARTVFDGALIPDATPTNIPYGISSTVRVLMSQGGSAADGYVNSWTDPFNVTGNIVYNIAGATSADVVLNTDVTADLELMFDIDRDILLPGYEATDVLAGIDDTNQNSTFSFAVPAGWFAVNLQPNDGIGRYEWKVRTEIDGSTIVILSPAPLLTLICDKFQVVDVRFQNGGGLSNPPDYHRNIYTAGTQMQVEVQMQYQGVAVNTTQPVDVVASYNYGGGVRATNLVIPAGAALSNWVEIENPSSVASEVPPGTTLEYDETHVSGGYQVSSIIERAGGRYEGGTGQNAVGRIIQDTTPPSIIWDHADPPGAGAGMFTPWISTTSTVDTITLNWTPLGADPEFSTYRIYYKPALAANWSMIDANTDPPATSPLAVIATDTYTITGLQSITEYQYYLTAIDIFGNETLAANRAHGGLVGDPIHAVTTGAYGLEVAITDGITAYDNTALITDSTDHLARPLYDSSIRFEVDIIGASQPDEINVIIANVTAAGFDALAPPDVFDLHPDTENEISASYDLAPAANGFFRIPIGKVSPNKWAGHISSENPLITPGQGCKFILEVKQGDTPSYYGYDPNLNMDTTRFTFSVIDPPKVTPWPTRILNNVITKQNPRAYPAYYLTDDAYVTITVYDIKGRPVATLLDNALRRNGQNIREQGWAGTNKAGRKLGIGLYYVHIKAKRVSDGKTIINKFEKVVMAK